MLIGNLSKRPDLNTIRRIKQTLREVLHLQGEVILTISELACMEEDFVLPLRQSLDCFVLMNHSLKYTNHSKR